MVAALFDTNILIDYLRGIDAARDELAYYTEKCISIITWMEVMAGAVPETEDRRPKTGRELFSPVSKPSNWMGRSPSARYHCERHIA
jgi:predicted nucleic acid-binding protein